MTDNYQTIVNDNLKRLYANLPEDLNTRLPASRDGRCFAFTAFGQKSVIAPDGITLDGEPVPSIIGILLSLYALNASTETPILEPLKAFKEFPDSAPYVGAFTSHTEQILVPAVPKIRLKVDLIKQRLGGQAAPAATGGDFAFVVRPLPKIDLCYIFYEADEDFPPSVTCLYSNNANRFMPMDGLADVGEYTSKTILNLK
ncbi:hypothetical protein DSCO28_54400 [Desulfosarcina ovata subsp. sediminis]|uniref:DUF3786 domain-containing protein n=2 Tax=Desulfosarcina ovata TaxID=83564 RepID=A0A5K7ZXG8_9BACT|nr:hypothetical protein DSCO28_54400 [Desulfosarcina ovata subsp. sediminis]